MSFKRKRPKNRRAGCLMCKWYKMNGAKDPRPAKERLTTTDSTAMSTVMKWSPE